ncbi:alpha/beta fold hydrolase [Nocardia sp. NPDC058176]|uniref:alpha/beta fold hydrolase n=1 Tax=Nocardia sp. NPDC058176 TaxID=3346368 RepID=UPI0036D80706
MLFVDEGVREGPAIVFVHGIAGSPDWFAAVAERLSGDFRVIRVDVRDQRDDFGVSARTAPVAELLDELAVSEVTVVGHSFGAEIALELATSSDRVARAVVVGQGPDYRQARIPAAAKWVVRPSSVRLAQRWAPAPVVRLCLRSSFAPGFRYESSPGLADSVVRDFRGTVPAALAYTAGARADDLAAHPLDARVAELDLPVLVVHGRRDHLYDHVSTLARYAAAGARTHLVEHAGHAPQVEQPDEFVTVLREFLRD